ncbi:MAG: oligosaccharide flippase family protein [Methylotenera sp.]
MIAVVSLRIMTTQLEPNDYGQWALLVAFQVFGSLFLINPVDQHVFRHAHAWWDNGTLLNNLEKYNRYIFFVSLFIAIVVLFWWRFIQISGNDTATFGMVAGLAVGSTLYFATWSIALNYLLNMMGFRVQSVIWTVISSLVGLASSTLLVMQYPHAISWIFGQTLGAAVGAIGAWRTLYSLSPNKSASARHIIFSHFLNRATILGFCLPLAAATGFMWLQNTGYRFWVGNVWGVAELGILVVGLGISAQLTAIIESLAMQFLYPYFARLIVDAKSNRQTGAVLSDLMNVLAPVYAIWAGFNAICAAALLEVLTDTRYHAAIPFVIFGAIIEFMRCTTNLWSNTARAIRRTKGLILPYGLGAVVVWLGAIGAAHFETGLFGLSFMLVLGGIVTSGAMMVLMQRLIFISIDVPRLAIGLIIMSACFVVAIISPMQTVGLYQNLSLLILSVIVACFLIAAMLWRNPALIRLLSASLRTD